MTATALSACPGDEASHTEEPATEEDGEPLIVSAIAGETPIASLGDADRSLLCKEVAAAAQSAYRATEARFCGALAIASSALGGACDDAATEACLAETHPAVGVPVEPERLPDDAVDCGPAPKCTATVAEFTACASARIAQHVRVYEDFTCATDMGALAELPTPSTCERLEPTCLALEVGAGL